MNEELEKMQKLVKGLFESVNEVNNYGIYFPCLVYDCDYEEYVFDIRILYEDVSVAMGNSLINFAKESGNILSGVIKIRVYDNAEKEVWSIRITSIDLEVISLAIRAHVAPFLKELNNQYALFEGDENES